MWSGKNGIMMNPYGIIRGNIPQGTRYRGFEISDSVAGTSDFSTRSVPRENDTIIENALFTNSGNDFFLKLKMIGAKIMKFSFKHFTPTRFLPNKFLTTRQKSNHKINMIRPTIVHYKNRITWESSLPRVNTPSDIRVYSIYTTACASTFPTTTSMIRNNSSLVHTKSTVHVPHCGTN